MFSIKGLRKEDLVIVATELVLKVEAEHRIVDLKKLIEESDEEVVCVMKKDGALRLCVDFRALNAITKVDDFPMENTTDLLFNIDRANAITTIDLLKGYWAILLEEESQKVACFKTHRAQYRFKVMAFGLRNASATFQREINKALSEYQDF